MTVREQLIEIFRKPIFPHELADPTEAVADYLLDNGVTVQRWIPVAERLPPTPHESECELDEESMKVQESGPVLVIADGGHMNVAVCRVWEDGTVEWEDNVDGNTSLSVTHWRPLPEPTGKEVGA